MSGTKHDQGKPDYTLIPKEALDAMARAFGHGQRKYGRGNYKAGIEYTRLAASCCRHLFAWLAGEDIDGESGNNHIDHALASLAMLAYHLEHSPTLDNRDHKGVTNEQKA
jgi:hypothetical protein